MPKKYDATTRAHAVQLVRQGRAAHRSEWSAITTVAAELGLNPETLRTWLRADDVAALGQTTLSAEAAQEIRALRRRNQKLQERIEILSAASDFFPAGGRPADRTVTTQQVLTFIDANKERFGIAPICHVLTEHGVKVAPRTYHAWAARPPSPRSLSDARYTQILGQYYEPDEQGRLSPEAAFGSARMWAHLKELGYPIGKSTVERLMRTNGWRGRRGRRRRHRRAAASAAGPEPSAQAGPMESAQIPASP
ncbi:MAG: IS3 family transposase [Phycicoccus sp.]|nr:IS3 family transposase [Phycicoccus sp.]